MFYWIRDLFRRRVVETELNDELRFHLEHQIEKHRRKRHHQQRDDEQYGDGHTDFGVAARLHLRPGGG